MKRHGLFQKSLWLFGTAAVISVILIMSGCTNDNPISTKDFEPTYSFTGYVIDGYSGKALEGADVTYYDDNGKSITITTRADGGFTIARIPYGNRSIHFSYPVEDGTIYATSVVTIQGNDWENFDLKGVTAGMDFTRGENEPLRGAIRNVAGPIKLYPLTGSLSGRIVAQRHERDAVASVEGAVVRVRFGTANLSDNQGGSAALIGANIEVGPSTFQATTDKDGRFEITGIPVSGDPDETVNVRVVSVSRDGIDWQMQNPNGLDIELVGEESVGIGSVLMDPIVSIPLREVDNNFKSGSVGAEHQFVIEFSDSLDDVSYGVLRYQDNLGTTRNSAVSFKVTGNSITITPSHSMLDEQVYTLTVYAYGLKGGARVVNHSVTVAGGGLSEVTSSNILTDARGPIYNYPVNQPISFEMSDTIVGTPSVRVSVDQDVIVSSSGETLTITPRSLWRSGTIDVSLSLRGNLPVRFSVPINVENPLGFIFSNIYSVTSNSPKNGLSLETPIYFVTNKPVADAKVILTEAGVSVPVTTTISEGNSDTITIVPSKVLKAATGYTLTLTVSGAAGESHTLDPFTFTTSAAQFYPVFDNVRLGNDRDLPRLDFAPNEDILIIMNREVKKATATLSGGVPVKVSLAGDTIRIKPESILTVGTAYNLSLSAEDMTGSTISGVYVTGLVPNVSVFIVASNLITSDGEMVTNVPRDAALWFKLNVAPNAASIKSFITNPTRDVVVSVNEDTLFITPVAAFAFDAQPTVNVTGVAVDGNYLAFTRSFRVTRRPQMTVVASNVLNSTFDALTNVPEDIAAIWYKMSRIPATVNANIDGVPVASSISDDTIFVTPNHTFASGATPIVSINGMDSDGLSYGFEGDGTDWAAFTIRRTLFPIASNAWDAQGNPVENFPIYETMWVKWSEQLNSDLAKIEWNPATLIGRGSNANATVSVSGDTLFVTPRQAAVTLNYGGIVDFNVRVQNTAGTRSNWSNFSATIEPSDINILATNTRDTNGKIIDTIATLGEVWVVSSKSFSKVDAITSVGGTPLAANNLIVGATIRTNGDTIFFKPVQNLGYDADLAINFDLTLTNGVKVTNELRIDWKTLKASNPQVVTTNTIDADGKPVKNFEPVGTMWVISSEPLDSVYGMSFAGTGTSPAAVNLNYRTNTRVSGDTIFYSPVDSLDLGTVYSVQFNVALATGETFTNVLGMVFETKAPQEVFVLHTNTLTAGGAVVETFGAQDEIWVVSNVAFASVDAIVDRAAGGITALPGHMAVLTNVRTTGDTIFFKPPNNLGAGNTYKVSFDVTLPSGQSVTDESLAATWKIIDGIKVVAVNDMASASTYRTFASRGDSLVVEFSQAVDTSEAFAVTGFGSPAKLIYSWNTALTQVVVKDTSMAGLTLKNFAFNPDYSVATGTAQYAAVTVALTSVHGEVVASSVNDLMTSGLRPPVEVHVETKNALLSANFVQGTDRDGVNPERLKADLTSVEDFPVDGNIVLTFVKEIDTAVIKAAPRDDFFALFNNTNLSVPLDYAISFSSDAKVVTINPVEDFDHDGVYRVRMHNVPSQKLTSTISGASGGNFVNDNGIEVVSTPTIESIASLTTTIALDTNDAADVTDKRIGASGGYSYIGGPNVHLENALRIVVTEAAWNANHGDSVDGYQWRARRVYNGVNGAWYEVDPFIGGPSNPAISTNSWSTAFNANTINPTLAKAQRSVDLNLNTVFGGPVLPQLQTKIDNLTGYSNADHIFNDSAVIELQVRAVKDINNDGTLQAGEFGVWSNTLTFADNIAPCDEEFVATANMNDHIQGGVSVGTAQTDFVGLDRTGDAGDLVYTITLTFPEDMDTSTSAAMNIYYGVALGTKTPATLSREWTSARNYVFTVTFANNTDYSTNAPYYRISVANMKDASNVTITGHGSPGTAANGVLIGDVTDEVQGSSNIQLLQLFN